MLTQTQQNLLIDAAISAPSADNSQPFLVHWQSTCSLELWIDETRSGKASDNRFVLSDIALGAVIESIVIKASSLSYATQVEYFPHTQQEALYVAKLTFSEASAADEQLAEALPKRCTDRRFPFKGSISKQCQQVLSSSAHYHNTDLQWYTDNTAIKAVIPTIQLAESIRFKSKMLHRELFSTINFTQSNTREGMHISVLAIEKPAQPLFKLLANWSVMKYLNFIGGASMLGLRSVCIPITFSPALTLITINDKDRLSVIQGGRALQRIWLTATNLGLSVQPYAAPGIFSLGYIEPETPLKHELNKVKLAMTTQVPKGFGLIFLRLGYNKPVTAKTQRRIISSFFKQL